MECSVCLNIFTSDLHKPLFMSWGHTLWITWVQDLRKDNGEFSCPFCAHSMIIDDVNQLPVNYSLINMPKVEQKQKELIKEAPWPNHMHKNVKLFCQDCNTFFCSLCVSQHSGHKIEVASDSIARFIDNSFEILTHTQEGLLIDLQKLKDKNDEILERNTVLKSSIVDMANQAMRTIKREKENLLIIIAESEATNETLINATEFMITDVNNQFKTLREFRQMGTNTQIATFGPVKANIQSRYDLKHNLKQLHFTSQNLPSIYLGFLDELTLDSDFQPTARWATSWRGRMLYYKTDQNIKLEQGWQADWKHIDIGNEIIDIKRMMAIDKTTRMRRPVKRISDYDIN